MSRGLFSWLLVIAATVLLGVQIGLVVDDRRSDLHALAFLLGYSAILCGFVAGCLHARSTARLREAGDKLFEAMPKRSSVWDTFRAENIEAMRDALTAWDEAAHDGELAREATRQARQGRALDALSGEPARRVETYEDGRTVTWYEPAGGAVREEDMTAEELGRYYKDAVRDATRKSSAKLSDEYERAAMERLRRQREER